MEGRLAPIIYPPIWAECVVSKKPVVERKISVPPIKTVAVSVGKNVTNISYEPWQLYLSNKPPCEGRLADKSYHTPPAPLPLPEIYLYFHRLFHSTCPKKFVSGIP